MKRIKIKFVNGLTFDRAKLEILNELKEDFYFEESNQPDFVVFGPYGNDIPAKGIYTRIGYFCENVKPDFNCCEWAFGVPLEDTINNPNYARIQWHGFDPQCLIKPLLIDTASILESKTGFCNFLYSNCVPYRETFFKALNKYKKVDAPGFSMNNMPNIDHNRLGDKWKMKQQFLQQYKFTIAFENDTFLGYQTEKLYDAMQAVSLPVYFGDPNIDAVFNTKSFIHTREYIQPSAVVQFLEKSCQQDFEDIRPQFFYSPVHRIKRNLKKRGRYLKMNIQLNKKAIDKIIDKIVEADENPNVYLEYLKQPWLNQNSVPESTSTKKQWIKIFNSR